MEEIGGIKLATRLRTRRGGHAAFPHGELFAAPADFVGCEAGQPYDEVDGVPEWDQPEFSPDNVVLDDPDTYDPGR